MNLQMDIKHAQQICELVKAQMGFGCSIMTQGGVIAASSAPERIGSTHQGSARILRGEIDEFQVTAEISLASGGKMKEGFNIPIIVNGERVASCGIAGPLETVRPLAYVLTSLIASVIALRAGDQNRADQLSVQVAKACLLYTSPSPRDGLLSRMPSSA